METIRRIALVFMIIGSILWGVIGVFNINLLDLLGDMYWIARIVYVIVGISGIIGIGFLADEDAID